MLNEVGLRLKELRRWKNRPGLTRDYVKVYKCPPVQKQGTVRANVSLLLSAGFIRDIHHTLSLKQKQAMSPVSH